MALIPHKAIDSSEKIKLDISSSLLKEVKQYMEWSGIDDISHIFEWSCEHVINNDKGWKKHKKSFNNKEQKIDFSE